MPLNRVANEKAKILKEQPFPHSHTVLPGFRTGLSRNSGMELRVRGFPSCSLCPPPSIPVKLTLETSNLPCSDPGGSHPLSSPPPAHTDTQESYLGCLMEIGGGAGRKAGGQEFTEGSRQRLGVGGGQSSGVPFHTENRGGKPEEETLEIFPSSLKTFSYSCANISSFSAATGSGRRLHSLEGEVAQTSGSQARTPPPRLLLLSLALQHLRPPFKC